MAAPTLHLNPSQDFDVPRNPTVRPDGTLCANDVLEDQFLACNAQSSAAAYSSD